VLDRSGVTASASAVQSLFDRTCSTGPRSQAPRRIKSAGRRSVSQHIGVAILRPDLRRPPVRHSNRGPPISMPLSLLKPQQPFRQYGLTYEKGHSALEGSRTRLLNPIAKRVNSRCTSTPWIGSPRRARALRNFRTSHCRGSVCRHNERYWRTRPTTASASGPRGTFIGVRELNTADTKRTFARCWRASRRRFRAEKLGERDRAFETIAHNSAAWRESNAAASRKNRLRTRCTRR